MAEEHELVEVGNTNHNRDGVAVLAEPTSTAWTSKFAAWIKALFCSSQNRASSVPKQIERSVARSSPAYSSNRIARMMQQRSEFETDLEFEVEASRIHWSELQATSAVQKPGATMEVDVSRNGAHLTNAEIVESLQRQWPKTGNFFYDYGDNLHVGAKIAEGAQAEIFKAKFAHRGDNDSVLKVFKEGYSLHDLQRQWPPGMLKKSERNSLYMSEYSSSILNGTVVMNGRFAFLMWRYCGDLRKFIDLRMQSNLNQRPPFCNVELQWYLLSIARGMKGLHKDGIIHRDLKASNVLIQLPRRENWPEDNDLVFSSGLFICEAADYECSIGVVGTGFWRAPEILQAVKDRNITPDLFTRASDVYSFAMTCYEMISGRLPFEDVRSSDYDVVLRGERPILPDDTKSWIKTLLSRCWDPNPRKRPNFKKIINFIKLNNGYTVNRPNQMLQLQSKLGIVNM